MNTNRYCTFRLLSTIRKCWPQSSRLAESIRPRFAALRGADIQTSIREALADVDARPSTFDGREVAISEEQRSVIINATKSRRRVDLRGSGNGQDFHHLRDPSRPCTTGCQTRAKSSSRLPLGEPPSEWSESLRHGLVNIRMSASADEALAAELPEAKTIHRLLGYSPSRQTFSHHRRNPLTAAVVVVDECSMLDLMLTERLVASLRPDAKLIMLGDSYQLPSVTAGAVFRDLVKAAEERFPHICSRLTHNYRTATGKGGKDLLAFSTKINDGVFDAVNSSLPITQHKAPESLHFEGVESIVDGKQLERVLGSMVCRKNKVTPNQTFEGDRHRRYRGCLPRSSYRIYSCEPQPRASSVRREVSPPAPRPLMRLYTSAPYEMLVALANVGAIYPVNR